MLLNYISTVLKVIVIDRKPEYFNSVNFIKILLTEFALSNV